MQDSFPSNQDAMTQLKLTNFDLLDTAGGILHAGCEMLIKDDLIAEVSDRVIAAGRVPSLDLGGRVVMPGLIDCHIHICAEGLVAYPQSLPSLTTARAAKMLKDTLLRGFTTVRDAGGADYGHKLAVEQGLFTGPRLFVSGSPLSQTAGHGDQRQWGELGEPCACSSIIGLSTIADGISQVRKAVRTQLGRRVDQIKIMASGGVSSPADPVVNVQYSMEELCAAVDEAKRAHTYVLAHAYSAQAIERAIDAGIRSIEHGNLINERVAAKLTAAGGFLVPTLVTYRKIIDLGSRFGLSAEQLEKAAEVAQAGLESLSIASRAGVQTAFGTDLYLTPHEDQCEEFLIRAEVQSPAEILKSATVISARLLRMETKIGQLIPGAFADLLVVDGNPLEDLGLLQDQGARMPLIMKGGERVKDELGDH